MGAAADIAVVGAGIVGLATAYELTEREAAVTVYDSGVPGNGQSGGQSRIFRHAHQDPRLVTFARASRALWREWQERLGVELVSGDGALALGDAAEDRLAVLDDVGGVAARRVGPAEISERLPILAPYTGPAMLDEEGGSIRTRAAIRALVGQLGDAIVTDEVLTVSPTVHGKVEVRTGGARVEHDSAVVCAGRGTPRLARGVGLSLPVRLAAHVRLTFPVRGRPPQRLACLQDSSGAFGETGVYGAPLPGNDAYALGLSQTTPALEDGTVLSPAELAALSERAGAYVARALPGLDPEPVAHRHCWTTELPWGSDGVAVWQADRALFVAGHNLFKQAPALGRALARAALGEELTAELRPESRLGAG